MVAVNDGGVILQLVVVFGVRAISDLIPSARERPQHRYGRLEVGLRTWIPWGKYIQKRLIAAVVEILEAGLVHNIRAQDLGVADLQCVFGGGRVVSLRRKRKLSNSLVVLAVLVELITDS